MKKGLVMPLSGKELCKLFEKAGYKIVPGGKGSHIKLKKKDHPTIIIPNHKELKNGLEHALMKLLKANI
jgi:predicted RNA binding protein YcfA (HicA-like mRNA interferase family)